ncbi:unnamed protein product [Mycena citricolor]|uniref:Anaphase-promoting complex subunit 5 n=1 Tax=Mycena citricolor TaxID=2018698 RepID=A0AAD2HLN5_9AGAR|nr:unnamed protein product [Mycena citricolor]
MDIPPTEHVLRAHHVGLLTLFSLTFKEFEGKLPPAFLLHIYRLLLNEVSEVAPPKSFTELQMDLLSASKAELQISRRLIAGFDAWRDGLATAERLAQFLSALPNLFQEKVEGEEEIPPTLQRRSIFGYFCRRCHASYLKLTFYGVGKLQKDYQSWCRGADPVEIKFPAAKDQLQSHIYNYRTMADKVVWARPDSYDTFNKAMATGNESVAVENLRRFFEQHFHENNDSGFRQHALLHLVRMHYVRQEYVAARKLLHEAIAIARLNNDRVTLQHCTSLLHRLPPTIPRKRPTLNETQPDLHPMEILYDVSKLMDEENGQPLSASFARIVEGVGLYDHWFDTQPIPPADTEQWAQHAVQSVLWTAAGCPGLAALEEDLVIAFTDEGGSDNNRTTVMLNKLYRHARSGYYDQALSALLHPSMWRGLSLIDYGLWAQEIWHILVLRATRRGQDRAYREILLPRRPPGEYKPRTYTLVPAGPKLSKIQQPLWEVIQMKQCDQATSTMDDLLTALWHSEFLGRLSSYRTGIILLADVSLEFGMSQRITSTGMFYIGSLHDCGRGDFRGVARTGCQIPHDCRD